MATMNGIDNHGFADNAKRLRRELAELKEMVKLGAGLPGDEQRIEMAKPFQGISVARPWAGVTTTLAPRQRSSLSTRFPPVPRP